LVPTRRFALERHAGPYASWPLRTRVLADGVPTGAEIAGYSLLHQWEVRDGYLLVADHDCPYEEATTFALLSRDLRVLGMRTLSALYGSYLLDGVEWLDERRLAATFHGGLRYEVQIRERGIPILRPRLRVRRIRD
jgi:hypothetical protein